jgi:streptogramin lyase
MPAPIQTNNAYPVPASYSPLSIQGHSLDVGVLTCNEGQWSNVSELIRTNTQAKLINNFQMLTRGIWSNPTGIGWSLQRSAVFNSGAAFMDFGILVDSQGNRTLLFQVGNTLYSYNLTTNTETAYGGALANLSTSLVNLPTMRNFVDSTNSIAPYTVYTNGAIQPQKIVTTADKEGVSTEYAIPTSASAPTSACVGPDGNIYVTESAGNKILQIVPFTGVIKEFVVPTAASQPQSICTGADGNLWFTEYAGNKIAKMTTLGAFTEYVLPTATSNPYGICLGPDNLIWFTEYTNNKISSITINGLITEYTIPTTTSKPTGICAGPDGLIWFTESNTDKIGKVTVSTSTEPLPGTFTEYVIPTSTSGPQSICAGPTADGRLWFTENAASKIGAITTSGTFTEYTTGLTAACAPYGICLGGDGNLWFTENATAANKIGSITPAGVITEYAIPTSASRPQGIVFGGNNQLWYVENATDKVAALQLANLPMQFIATVNTTPTTPTVAITEYAIPNTSTTTSIAPYDIISAPDGNIYFMSFNNPADVWGYRITTAGVVTPGYDIESPTSLTFCAAGNVSSGTTGNLYIANGEPGIVQLPFSTFTTGGAANLVAPTAATVNGMCVGPDGNIWATLSNSTILKITPASAVTTFTIPTGSSNPGGICIGPDKNLWFTEQSGNKIGTVTTSGAFTEYNIGLTASCTPYDIVAGPDGNLWFTENTGNKIGRITTGGTITEFALPTANAGPTGLCEGQDGNIYFCENTASKIGLITTAGVITEYPTPTATAGPLYICLGPDNNLWFTENTASQIGKLVRTVSTELTLTTETTSWPGVFYLNGKTYSKPKYNCYFNNRQVYFGFDPSGLAAYDVLISAQGNAESFVNSTPINATDACSFTFADTGLGLPTGCTSFRLANINNQEILLLGFQKGFTVIAGNGISSDATTYQATILTKEYGLMSNRTFTQIQNDMYFLSTNGVRNYSNLSINANLLNSNLTFQMQDVIQGITSTLIAGTNVGYNSQAFSVHNQPTLEVQYWYPGTSDGVSGANFTNQHAIIMNYNALNPSPQQLTPVFTTKSGTSVSCGIYFNGVFYGGGYDGHLQVHYSGNTYNGVPIPGTIVLALLNNGNIQQNQELRQGVVVTEGGLQNFNVVTYFYTKTIVNGIDTVVRAPSPEGIQNIQLGVGSETVMGEWDMGFSSFPANHIKHGFFQATGQGPYIEFDLTTNGLSQALDFGGLAATLTVGGLRP